MKGLRAWAPDLGSNPSSSPWLQGFYMPEAGDTSRVTEVLRPVRTGRPRPLTTGWLYLGDRGDPGSPDPKGVELIFSPA